MTGFVALLRGINVGGHRKMPMAELRAVAEGLGLENVQTYVQSGNMTFEAEGTAPEIAVKLEAACAAHFGFETEIMVRDAATFRAEVEACPFAEGGMPAGGREAKFLHLCFLSSTPDAARLEALFEGYQGPEEIALKGDVLHVYFTDGTGRSKLHPLLDAKKLGVSLTARNWNTVQKLLEMLDGR